MTEPTAVWMKRVASKVLVAPVLDLAHALDNPFVEERGDVQEFEYADGRRAARLLANPIRISGATLPQRAGPRLGEHNETVLREAGFDAEAIERLRALGVIGRH